MIFSKQTEIHGKNSKLIAVWQDLAAYYDDGEITWKYQSGGFVNMGETKEFRERLQTGQIRGKFV